MGRYESRNLGRGHRHDQPVLGAQQRGEGPWDSWNSYSPQIVFISKECLRSHTNIQENAKDRQKPYFRVKGIEVILIFLLKESMSLTERIHHEPDPTCSSFYNLPPTPLPLNASEVPPLTLISLSISLLTYQMVGGNNI